MDIVVINTHKKNKFILYPFLSIKRPINGTKIIAKINSIVIYYPAITYLSRIFSSVSEF